MTFVAMIRRPDVDRIDALKAGGSCDFAAAAPSAAVTTARIWSASAPRTVRRSIASITAWRFGSPVPSDCPAWADARARSASASGPPEMTGDLVAPLGLPDTLAIGADGDTVVWLPQALARVA